MVSFTDRIRFFAKRARDIFRNEGPWALFAKFAAVARDRMVPKTYARWIRRYDRWSAEDRRTREAQMASWGARPSISVLMAVGGADLPQLGAAIRSLGRQLYVDREICIACVPSIQQAAQRQWSDKAHDNLPVRIACGEESETRSVALNRALRLATGDFIVVMDADAELAEQALYRVAKTAIDHPDVDLIFWDEDKICLLYTSPSPRDRQKSRMPSSA